MPAVYQYLWKVGFPVDYVIEDRYSLDDCKVVPRSADTYPDTPLIVIADIFNIDAIRQKLALRGMKSVVSIYEVTSGKADEHLRTYTELVDQNERQMVMIAEKNTSLQQAEKRIQKLQSLQKAAEERDRRFRALQQTAEKQDREAAAKDARIRELEALAANLTFELETATARNAQRESSFSWRITEPLRRFRYWQLGGRVDNADDE